MNQKIDELITRYLQEEVSEAEIEHLDKWLSEDDSHIRYFFRRKNLYDIYHPAPSPEGIDVQKALRRTIPSVYRRKRLIRYGGIAALLLLSIGIPALFFLPLKQQIVPLAQIPETVSDTIPGITLTLADGKKIDIKEQGIDEITSSGNIIAEIKNNSVRYQLHDSVLKNPIYHVLTVPRGKECFLTLSDGTKIWVNAATKVRYPIRFAADKRQIFVDGEVYLEVARDTSAPFTVKMPKNEVIVLGTSFNVKSYPEEGIQQITLVSGKIKVISERSGREVTLLPGEQATLADSGENIITRKVNTDIYCGWHEGKMVFQDHSLEEILHILERRYDMNVTWKDESLKTILFSGEISVCHQIEKLLKIISHTGDVEFAVNGREIIVKRP